MVKIQHGCTKQSRLPNTYLYTEHKVGPDGLLDTVEYNWPFETDEGEVPEIGDFISNERLIKRTSYQVNSDWRMWKDKDLYGNP